MPPIDTRHALNLLWERLSRHSAQSLTAYLQSVVVDCVPVPRQYGEVREHWQQQRDQALVPAVEFVSGLRDDYTGPMNFWLNYAKGHDKSSYLARLLNWGLAFAPRKGMRFYCGAKDADQAGVILDCMGKEAALNPWIKSRLSFKRNGADSLHNDGQLRILTSDAGGNQGKNPDVIVADELTHWASPELFDSLYSGVGKRGDRSGRQRCVFAIITNAGVLGSWQDRVRQLARESHGTDWYFYEQPEGQLLASWLSKEAIASQCRLLSPTEADRLWRNRWTDPTEDRGAFSPSDVDACLGQPSQPPPGADVFLSLDYGGVKDRTALSVVWFDGQVLHVVGCDCWQGSGINEVKINDIDTWIDRQFSLYPDATAVFDKHQLLSVIQRLELAGRKVVRFDYKGGKQNHAMFENLRSLLQNRRMRFTSDVGMHPYDGSSLLTEFKSVLRKKMTYGDRIDHESGEHDDRVVSVGMGALHAVTSSTPPPQQQLRTQPQEAGFVGLGGGFSSEHFLRRGHFHGR